MSSEKSITVLGLDGGGTKTEAVLMNKNGEALSVGIGGPTNLAFVSQEVANKSVEDAVDQAIQETRSNIESIAMVGVCFVGKKPTEHIVRRIGYDGEIVVFREGQVVFARAGIYELRGIAVVAGTGSSFFGYDGNEQRIAVGGWGPVIGEEGSAFDIGLQGIRSAGRYLDGRGSETILLPRALEHYDVPIFWDILSRHCRPTIDQHGIASFAKVVTAAAYEGDEVAKDIVAAAAESLASNINFAASRLFKPNDEFPIALAGGVFSAGDLIIEPLKDAVLTKFPNAIILLPVIGAGEAVARLALRRWERGYANVSD